MSSSGLGCAGRDEPDDLELVSIVVEFKAPLILVIEDAVAVLDIGSDSSAKLFEHRLCRTLRLRGNPIEVVGDVVR